LEDPNPGGLLGGWQVMKGGGGGGDLEDRSALTRVGGSEGYCGRVGTWVTVCECRYASAGTDIVLYETGGRLVSGRQFPSRGFALIRLRRINIFGQ
jgi:hypothetical protein